MAILLSPQLTWFDWSFEVRHEALWSDGLQELNLSTGQKSLNLAHRVRLYLFGLSAANSVLQLSTLAL